MLEQTDTQTFGAWGTSEVVGEIGQGEFTYQGGTPDQFVVDVRSWGQGSSKDRAAEKRDANSWDVSQQGTQLVVAAESAYKQAGVDFDVSGPSVLGIDVSLDEGTVNVSDVEGVHRMVAPYLYGQGVVGDLTANSLGGEAVLKVTPFLGGTVDITVEDGSLDLAIPAGLAYDLQVWSDPGFLIDVINDMGFEEDSRGEDFYAARAGDESVRVRIHAVASSVTIRAL